MKKVYVIIILFLNCISSNSESLYDGKSVYWSDRDNFYPNGFVSALAVQDEYLYPLLDTGNTGVAKLFKVKMQDGFNDPFVVDTVIRDKTINWQLYFGGNEQFILREQKLCFINKENNIRLLMLQRSNDICYPRIVDVSQDGEIIMDSLIQIPLGLDAMIKRIDDDNYLVAFTDKTMLNPSTVKLMKFNISGSIGKSSLVQDNKNMMELANLGLSKTGEILLATAYNKRDCFWNATFLGFDIDLQKKFEYTDNRWEIPFRHTVIARAIDGAWIVEFPLAAPASSLKYPPSYLEKRYYFYNDSMIDVPHTDTYYSEWIKFIHISQPYSNSFFRLGTKIFNNAKQCEIFNISKLHFEMKAAGRSRYSGMGAFGNTTSNVLTNVYEKNSFELYGSSIYGDSAVVIRKFIINPQYISVNNQSINVRSNQDCRFFSGETASIKIPNELIDLSSLLLYDFMGNKISTQDLANFGNEIHIPLHNLSNGVYFWHIPELNIKGKFGVLR